MASVVGVKRRRVRIPENSQIRQVGTQDRQLGRRSGLQTQIWESLSHDSEWCAESGEKQAECGRQGTSLQGPTMAGEGRRWISGQQSTAEEEGDGSLAAVGLLVSPPWAQQDTHVWQVGTLGNGCHVGFCGKPCASGLHGCW